MLKFGTITSINPLTARARVSFVEDNMTSFWLPILQNKTFKDKFYVIPDVGEQVACLMDEHSEDGVILGAIYTTEDTPKSKSEKEISLRLEDNSLINIDKTTGTLTINFKNIQINGDINQNGKLINSLGISSDSDISDKTSTMQAMRDTYNSHMHSDKNTKTTQSM